MAVPGDFSSAAFPLVAAALVPGSEVTIGDVGLNPTRIGLLGILNRMGAAVEVEEAIAGRRRAGRRDRGPPRPAGGTRVGGEEIPLAIDELPLVALLLLRRGETVVSGAEELRHKESDRIATVVEGLRGLAPKSRRRRTASPSRGKGGLRGGTIDSRGDHRLAMLGAVAGLASREGVEVEGFDAAGVSYPGFEADLRVAAGLELVALAGVAVARPGGEHQQEARVLGRPRPRGARWDRTRPAGPAPPLAASPLGSSILTWPETTSSQARSWT